VWNCFAPFSRDRVGQVHAHNRRSLGQSVTFKDVLVESVFECFREIERKFFGAGNNQAQTTQLVRLGFTQIAAQKSRRRQKQGKFVFLDQRSILRHFERIWIGDDADAFDQRIPKRDGRSEAVKKRQRRENRVLFLRI